MTEISIDEVSNRFEEHLAIENNNRIIFSGKFGTGKTYFLNKFFEKKVEKYNKIIISPANYVVSANEDIFELIKADIIRELFFSEKIKFIKSEKKNLSNKINLFVGEKPHILLKTVTTAFKKVKPFFEIGENFYDAFSNLYTEFKKYEEELKESLKTNEEELMAFLDSFNDTKGSPFENDFITRTINSQLEKLKGKEENKKKNVLIIDDLDRIDPEHIFRILNILSVHNNQFGAENKFKFEHVIIVCDIDNIRKIFEHKYGRGVDFDGYMDKFYSADYFIYRNIDAVNFYIDSFSDQFQSKEEKSFVKLVLQSLVLDNKITVRKLLKHRINFSIAEIELYQLDYKSLNYSSTDFGEIDFQKVKVLKLTSQDLRILQVFKLLSVIFGNLKIFKQSISFEKNYPKILFTDNDTFINAIGFLSMQKHIASGENINCFFSLTGEWDTSGKISFLRSVKKPITAYDTLQFSIDTKWNHNNKFEGNTNYFENATIGINNTRNQNTDSLKFNSELFWETIFQLMAIANTKKYFQKVGLVY